jgi:hypothetical protein
MVSAAKVRWEAFVPISMARIKATPREFRKNMEHFLGLVQYSGKGLVIEPGQISAHRPFYRTADTRVGEKETLPVSALDPVQNYSDG